MWQNKLRDNGWFTPDTYNNYFKPLTDSSVVYLFLLHKTPDYKNVLVAYVGMSINLEQRMSGHNILKQLDVHGYWAQRWFKPTPNIELRDTESKLISEMSPPWNIQGRKRGVQLI